MPEPDVLTEEIADVDQGIVKFIDAGQLGIQDKRKKRLTVDEINLIVSLAKGEQPEHELFKAVLLPEIHQNNNDLNIQRYIPQVDDIEIPNLQHEEEILKQVKERFHNAQEQLQKLLAKTA